ncbi:MAG: hypothetical protein IKF19_04480 [Bacilli bacterium]|nr:hypothetical protein [Bacilli bacterium]
MRKYFNTRIIGLFLFMFIMFLNINECYAETYDFTIEKEKGGKGWSVETLTSLFKSVCTSTGGVKGSVAAESCTFYYKQYVYDIHKKKFGKGKTKKLIYDSGNVNGAGIKGSKSIIKTIDVNCPSCSSADGKSTVKKVPGKFRLVFANTANIGSVVQLDENVSKYCKNTKLSKPMDEMCKLGSTVPREEMAENHAKKSYEHVEEVTGSNRYSLKDVDGEDLNSINSKLKGKEVEKKNCKELLGKKLINKIKEIVNIIRISVPILLIVFGVIDFGKAIFVSDENEMKKSQSRFIRRLIVAVAFFLIPTLLAIVLNIGHRVWDVIPSSDDAFCGIISKE